jgi:hypothetical protein
MQQDFSDQYNTDEMESFFMQEFGVTKEFILNIQCFALEQVQIAFTENKDVLKIITDRFLPRFVRAPIPYNDQEQHLLHYLQLYANFKIIQYAETLKDRLKPGGTNVCTRSRTKIHQKIHDLAWIVQNVSFWDEFHK